MNKKIFLFFVLLIVVIPVSFASADLAVRSIEPHSDITARARLYYNINIENRGDAPAFSRLAVRVWTNTDSEEVSTSWFPLVENQEEISVLSANGTIRREIPQNRNVMFRGADSPINTKTIVLYPGDSVEFDSETLSGPHSINFFLAEHSLEGTPGTIYAYIDPHDEVEESEENNLYRENVTVKGSITKGPFEGSRNIPSLNEGEYFVLGQGCANVLDRRICAGDEGTGDNSTILVTVDSEEMEMNRYNPIFMWIVRLLAEGRESPYVELNGVTVSLYRQGFKIAL